MAEAQNPLLQPLPDGIVPAAAVARTEKHWLLVMAGMLAVMMAIVVVTGVVGGFILPAMSRPSTASLPKAILARRRSATDR